MTAEGVRGNLVLGRSAEGRPGETPRGRDIEPLRNKSMNTMSRGMMKSTMTTTKMSTMVKNKVGTMRMKATTRRTELPRKKLLSQRSQPERKSVRPLKVGASSHSSRITILMSLTMIPCSMAEGTGKLREWPGKWFWTS